jgi:predicted GH43/DUF377 family glycosyl hydrolase
MNTRVTLLAIALLLSAFAFLPGIAYADNGQWVKYSGTSGLTPIVTPTSGSWDSAYTITPRVLYDGNTYRMWFSGGNTTYTAIGYAGSSDGLSWNVNPNPVLTSGPIGAWDSGSVAIGSVLMNGTQIIMYYRGTNPTTYVNGAIGMARSNDGITWTKYSGNPVLTPTLFGPDQGYIASPFVIKLQLTYNMWYAGRNVTFQKQTAYTTIQYATSLNGINWTKWPRPVLTPSTDSNAWDSVAVYSPSVYFNGTKFGLWYTGLGQSLKNPQIGVATSPDGATWTRSSYNPILTPNSGAWDSIGVESPNVIVGRNGAMMYYDGLSDMSAGRIGLAFAAPGVQVFPVPEFPYMDLLLVISVFAVATAVRQRKQAK